MGAAGLERGRTRSAGALRGLLGGAVERLAEQVGGRRRVRVVVLLASVLALDAADKGTVGAVAAELERDLQLSHVQIGLVATVSSIVGALATVPVGLLTDRVSRVRLLWISVALWCAAMIATGASGSLEALLLSRVALGAVTATAGPTMASLVGDLFPAAERAHIWGVILGGELVGAGIGLVGSGEVAGVLSWRWGFWWLAIPGIALLFALRRFLPEPPRGGQAALEPTGEAQLVHRMAKRHSVRPQPDLVLRTDPSNMRLGAAVRYVLRIRTNVVLIVASSLSYFFFAGVQVFTVVLLRARYGVSQTAASALIGVVGIGALAGVIAGGRIADARLRAGRLTARVRVAVAANLLAVAALVPALVSHDLALSLPLFVLGAAAMSAGNAPLSAARLDIMHPRLWGRAEGVRTFAQMAAVAAAPLLFGFVSQQLGGPSHTGAGAVAAGRHGLAPTFLIMLAPLALSALILRRAIKTYPGDVATAAASVAATSPRRRDAPSG